MIGISPDSFWVMTPREFFNAWKGWQTHQSEFNEAQFKAQRALIFGAARWLGTNIAMSKEQSNHIANTRFDWETSKTAEISVHDKIGLFIRIQEHKQKKRGRN